MGLETVFIENQVIALKNCISKTYKSSNIAECLLDFYSDAEKIGCIPLGKTVIKLKTDSNRKIDFSQIEILSRVDKIDTVGDCFSIKEKFELYYGVKIRHEGSFSLLNMSTELLLNYLTEKGYQPITDIFCTVIKKPQDNSDVDTVLDIYVGISPNAM